MASPQVIKKLADIVGSEWASTADADRGHYVDAYSPSEPGEYIAAGFVAPASVEEVQAVVRLANEHSLPLWPVSTGRNLAFGGAAPRTRDTIVLDLKRMNRILEVNEELAYAVVEPGVSFFDLYRHLKDNGHKLWMSVPGPGWGSIIGNALERGAGYGRDSDHFATSIGMEVVLPDGELLRTGMGAMSKNDCWHAMPYGFGPMVDGLFSQSGLGVVTKMGRFLTPEPDGFMGCEFSCDNESDLIAVINTFRPFKLNGMIDTPVVMGNMLNSVAYDGRLRSEIYDGPGQMPQDVLEKLQKETGLPWWGGFFGLYGSEEQVRPKWKLISDAVKKIPRAHTNARFYPRGAKIEHFRDASLSGTPHLHEFGSLNWKNSGAHLIVAPTVPMTGEHAERAYSVAQTVLHRHGLDNMTAMYCEARYFRLICAIVFDTTDAAEKTQVRAAYADLIREFADLGYGEYRTHLGYMDQVAGTYDFNNGAMLKFQELLKQTIDPNGIIAPGKSGIWGAYKR